MKDILPEEKLLRLIKGHKKPDLSRDKESTTAISELKPVIKQPTPFLIQKYLSFLNIRKIIGIVFVVSFIYLVSSFSYPWIGLREIKLPILTRQTKMAELKIEPTDQIKPFEFYLEAIRDRQMFGNVSAGEMEQPASGIDTDLIKDINLVGIISGENPVGIIEDQKTHKTYYLTKGQSIGELRVEDILEGKVILNYKGQRFELYL